MPFPELKLHKTSVLQDPNLKTTLPRICDDVTNTDCHMFLCCLHLGAARKVVTDVFSINSHVTSVCEAEPPLSLARRILKQSHTFQARWGFDIKRRFGLYYIIRNTNLIPHSCYLRGVAEVCAIVLSALALAKTRANLASVLLATGPS